MSLLLSWQNPIGLFDRPESHRAQLWCIPAKAHVRGYIIDPDVVWGFHEVAGTLDPEDSFVVRYVSGRERSLDSVPADKIKIWERPAKSCRVDTSWVRPDGSPWAGRIIEITDRETQGSQYSRRLVTNSRGEMAFVLIPDARVIIRIQGEMKALDVCVPDRREIGWDELTANATIINADRRGWY